MRERAAWLNQKPKPRPSARPEGRPSVKPCTQPSLIKGIQGCSSPSAHEPSTFNQRPTPHSFPAHSTLRICFRFARRRWQALASPWQALWQAFVLTKPLISWVWHDVTAPGGKGTPHPSKVQRPTFNVPPLAITFHVSRIIPSFHRSIIPSALSAPISTKVPCDQIRVNSTELNLASARSDARSRKETVNSRSLREHALGTCAQSVPPS